MPLRAAGRAQDGRSWFLAGVVLLECERACWSVLRTSGRRSAEGKSWRRGLGGDGRGPTAAPLRPVALLPCVIEADL